MATSTKEQLNRIEAKLDKQTEEIVELKVDLAAHKVKSGLFGAISGALSAIAAFLWMK